MVADITAKLSANALNKVVAKTESMGAEPAQGTSFKEMLAKMESGAEFADMLDLGTPGSVDPSSQMMSLGGADVAFTAGEDAVGVAKPQASEKVLDLLGEVNKGQMQMDTLVNHILYSGKKFSNQELIVIQAHVFHFAQMTELTVKVAEQGVTSVKSLLNTQVQ